MELIPAFICVLASWLLVAGFILLVYLAISVADFGKLLGEVLCLSVHATWVIPAILLVALRSPLAEISGILLVCNAGWLLLSGPAPETLSSLRRSAPQASGPARDFRSNIAGWLVWGAVCLQLGVCGVWLGRPFAGTALAAAAVSIWTLSLIASGLFPRRKRKSASRSVWVTAATVAAATFLLALELQRAPKPASHAARDLSIVQAAEYLAQQIAAPPPLEAPQRKVSSTQVFAGTADATLPIPDGVPGVILRPASKRSKPIRLTVPQASTHPSVIARVTVPFTGEYYLFPVSTGGIPSDSLLRAGTPLEAAYKSTIGAPIETEAYQPISPPFDFSNCSQLQMTISSSEESPGFANVQLFAGNGWLDIGSDLFGFGYKPGGAEQTLAFEVPLAPPRSLAVSAIRVFFHRDPSQASRSAKIAVIRFELVPRK